MKSFLAEQKLLYCICKSVKNANCKSHSIICNRIWKSSFFVLRLCMTMLKNFVQKTSAIGCFCIWNIYIEFHPQEPARELKDQFSIILVVHQFRSPVILERSINLLIYHTTVVLLRHPNAAAVLGAWIVIMVLVQDTTLSNCEGARNNCCNNFSEQILPNPTCGTYATRTYIPKGDIH